MIGLLYSVSLPLVIVFSLLAELTAITLFYMAKQQMNIE